MVKLWQKNSRKLHPLIEKYTVGEDYILDLKLMPYDIQATQAHAKGLNKIGILSTVEFKKTIQCLTELEKEFKQGKIRIREEDEDCHTVIENYLIKKLGIIGKKIHTGRSRNDQVLVALRLCMKDNLGKIKNQCLSLAKILFASAKQYQNIPFPGYSHTQQAMLSGLGHYFCAFLESLLDDLDLLDNINRHLDKNPLGSAAGFGVSFPLDRALTAKDLNFSKVQVNSLYCQNSRGKFDSLFLEGLTQIMLTIGKLANDLILFTGREFDFFAVKENLVTGSSIMPQKKNFDALEILRGNVSRVINNQHLVKEIGKNLLSGYNRDFQLMKKPLMESAEIVSASLAVLNLVIQGITPKRKNIEDKIFKDIFAADLANELVKKEKIPFRDAYQKSMDQLKHYKIDFQKNIKSKISLGSPGNLNLKGYEKRITGRKIPISKHQISNIVLGTRRLGSPMLRSESDLASD